MKRQTEDLTPVEKAALQYRILVEAMKRIDGCQCRPCRLMMMYESEESR